MKNQDQNPPYYWKKSLDQIYVIADPGDLWRRKLQQVKCRFMTDYIRRGKAEKSQYICPVEVLKEHKITRKVGN